MPEINQQVQQVDIFQRGDLVFKNCEGSFEVGKVIQVAQFFSSILGEAATQNSRWEHAALVVSAAGDLIEAVSGGITRNAMTPGADYIVFRCLTPAVAEGAALTAEMFEQNKQDAAQQGETIFGYSLSGAIKAWASRNTHQPNQENVEARIDSLFPELAPGQPAEQARDLFCSQFAALCYAIGAEQNGFDPSWFMSRQDHVLTPAQMVTLLDRNLNWQFVGIRRRILPA